jgi:glycosyltransferase involved in cell wall biosynthesis
VLAQSYAPIELVLVDDGSTDRSAEIVRAYGDAVVFGQQARGGASTARNHGVRLASGAMLSFLDADDRLVPEALDRLASALAAHPDLEVAHGHMREFLSPELTHEQAASIRPPEPEPTPWAMPTAMLVSRAALERVGRFDERLKVGDALDWAARARHIGVQSVVIPEVTLERRLHSQNSWARNADSRTEYLSVVRGALARRRAEAGIVDPS